MNAGQMIMNLVQGMAQPATPSGGPMPQLLPEGQQVISTDFADLLIGMQIEAGQIPEPQKTAAAIPIATDGERNDFLQALIPQNVEFYLAAQINMAPQQQGRMPEAGQISVDDGSNVQNVQTDSVLILPAEVKVLAADPRKTEQLTPTAVPETARIVIRPAGVHHEGTGQEASRVNETASVPITRLESTEVPEKIPAALQQTDGILKAETTAVVSTGRVQNVPANIAAVQKPDVNKVDDGKPHLQQSEMSEVKPPAPEAVVNTQKVATLTTLPEQTAVTAPAAAIPKLKPEAPEYPQERPILRTTHSTATLTARAASEQSLSEQQQPDLTGEPFRQLSKSFDKPEVELRAIPPVMLNTDTASGTEEEVEMALAQIRPLLKPAVSATVTPGTEPAVNTLNVQQKDTGVEIRKPVSSIIALGAATESCAEVAPQPPIPPRIAAQQEAGRMPVETTPQTENTGRRSHSEAVVTRPVSNTDVDSEEKIIPPEKTAPDKVGLEKPATQAPQLYQHLRVQTATEARVENVFPRAEQAPVKELPVMSLDPEMTDQFSGSPDYPAKNGENQAWPEQVTDRQALAVQSHGLTKATHNVAGSMPDLDAEAVRKEIPEQVVNQTRERLAQHELKPGNQQITLTLSPENLGELKMNLNLQGQKLSVEIVTETRTVRDALAQHADALKESLARQNITMESFDITTGGKNSGNQGQNQNAWRELARQQQQQFWTSSGRYLSAQADLPSGQSAYQRKKEHPMLDIHY